MARIRFFVGVLALLSILVALWAAVLEGERIAAGVLVAAAACLGAVCSFDAPDPRRRTRVVLACGVYVVLLGVLIVYTHNLRDAWSVTVALFLLLEAGVGLTGWALATRKRSRLPGSSRYYDI